MMLLMLMLKTLLVFTKTLKVFLATRIGMMDALVRLSVITFTSFLFFSPYISSLGDEEQ